MRLFLLVSSLNLALIVWIIRVRGLVSAEGICMLYRGIAVGSGNALVVRYYFFAPGQLRLGMEEITLRIYPTIIHILGLLALRGGLSVWAPRPRPVVREVSLDTLDRRNLL